MYVCVCMYVCMYIYFHACDVKRNKPRTAKQVYVCVYVYMYTCINVTQIEISLHAANEFYVPYIRTHTYMHTYSFCNMPCTKDRYVHVYTHARMHTHTHTHTQTIFDIHIHSYFATCRAAKTGMHTHTHIHTPYAHIYSP